jgi:HEAT repeat protein
MRERTRYALVVWLLSGASALLPGACGSSTSIEKVWAAPQAMRPTLHRVLALYVSRDATPRRSAEDTMARALGTDRAVPAYRVLADEDYGSADKTRAKLRSSGFDGVVSMRMVGRVGRVVTEPSSTYPAFDAYWGTVWSSGLPYVDTTVRMETAAYSLQTSELVWSALSKTFDPSSAKQLVNDVARAAAKELAHAGVIPRPEAS